MKDPRKTFMDAGALKEGHFLLASGKHSGYYFQAQSALQHPSVARETGKALAEFWKNEEIETVVSLAVGGVLLGHETAKALETRHIFAERKKGEMGFHRGFSVRPGERVLIVEDVITTGGSVREVIGKLESSGADIKGIAALLKRGKAEFKHPLRALMEAEWEAYDPSGCPLCLKRLPLSTPGTKQFS